MPYSLILSMLPVDQAIPVLSKVKNLGILIPIRLAG
jgi:hypothetical protein